jgi:hypothetical protein
VKPISKEALEAAAKVCCRESLKCGPVSTADEVRASYVRAGEAFLSAIDRHEAEELAALIASRAEHCAAVDMWADRALRAEKQLHELAKLARGVVRAWESFGDGDIPAVSDWLDAHPEIGK